MLVDLFAGGTGVLVNEALTELGVPDEFRWIVTISTTLAVGYVGNKYFVFNNKGDIVRMVTDDEIAQATTSAKGSGGVKAEDIKFADKFNDPKYAIQPSQRGWTNQKIADAINNPYKVVILQILLQEIQQKFISLMIHIMWL